MSNPSPLLRQILQILNENPDTWGDVVNISALQTLEDAIAGIADVDVTSANVTLVDTDGGPSSTQHSRYMILDINGSPGAPRDVIVPEAVVPPDSRSRTKLYLAYNNTGDASAVTVKTLSGTGITIPAGEAHWVWCDGTNVLDVAVANATRSATCALADDSTLLAAVAATEYAQLNVQQTWGAGQVITRTLIVEDTSVVTPTIDTSNSFYALWDGNYQLAAPTGSPQNGQQFSLVVQQGPSGGPFTISYAASTFIWEGGTAPVLSTGANDIDYFGFEYATDLVGGARWIGAVMKGLS